MRTIGLLLLAACGGSGGGGPDGPPGRIDAAGPGADADVNAVDAMADAGIGPDAMPAPVTVHVPALGEGVPIAFNDAAGAIVAVEYTDVNGRVSALVPPGSMATFEGSGGLVTIAGLQPGDVIERAPIYTPPPSIGSMSVSIPGHGGGTDAYASAGCGLASTHYGSNLTASITLHEGCTTGGLVNLFALDEDAVNGFAVVAWTALTDLTWIDTGSLTFPTWSATWTQVPVTVTGAATTHTTAAIAGQAVRDQRAFGVETATVGVSGGATSFTVRLPTGFAQGAMIDVNLYGPGGSQGYAQRTSTIPTGVTLDGTDLLPIPSDITITPDATEPERFTVGWTGSTAAASGIELITLWTPAGGGAAAWSVLLAPGAATFRYPDLPTILAPLGPHAGETFAYAQLSVRDESWADWTAVRTTDPAPPDADYVARSASASGN